MVSCEVNFFLVSVQDLIKNHSMFAYLCLKQNSVLLNIAQKTVHKKIFSKFTYSYPYENLGRTLSVQLFHISCSCGQMIVFIHIITYPFLEGEISLV